MPKSPKPPVIVLDGPAGAGKSSVAKRVAERLALPFLDTGAIYRAITLAMTREGIPPVDSSPELAGKLRDVFVSFADGRVFLNDEDVTEAIRAPEIDLAVSPYSALPSVRAFLLDIQRNQAKHGLVAEGRDMGTVVFPAADLKIFLTATPEARAERRYRERIARGERADYEEILRQVNRRDEIDSKRDVAPLKRADDAIFLDTTNDSFERVVEIVLEHAAGLRA